MFNNFLDKLSEFFAVRKGLLPILGILLIILNWILQLLAPQSGLAGTNFFLHLGVITALVGMLLAWAL